MKITFYNYMIEFTIDNGIPQNIYESATCENEAKHKAICSIQKAYGSCFLISIKQVKKQNKVCTINL